MSGRNRQRGAVAYMFAVLVITATTSLMVMANAGHDPVQAREQALRRNLQQTREALVSYLALPALALNATDTGRRLGEWRLFPDLPLAAGAGLDASEPNYDGQAETGGCAYRGWSPGQPLLPVATSAAAARCVGRLPWRELGFDLVDTDPATDGDGRVPWVVVSPNLMVSPACLPDFTPLLLTRAFAGYGCAGAPPYPWITVLDERGNPLSTRVALAVVLPGPPLAGQSRGANAAPSQYLDRVTIAANCPVPCQPGSYDNANFNHADGTPTVLIGAPTDARRAERAGFYGAPYSFNDRIAYLTIDDLVAQLERRARQELVNKLRAFRATQGYFPYAAAFNAGAGDCLSGTRFGHPAATDGNCGAGRHADLAQWFIDGGWHRYFVYAVSPRCVVANSACTAPGLTVDAGSAVNALVIAPGSSIVTPPYAPSRGIAQLPLAGLGLALTAVAADFVDNPVNAGIVPDVFASTGNQAAPQNDRLEILN